MQLYDLRQVAAKLNLSVYTVRKMVFYNQLPTIQFSPRGKHYIEEDALKSIVISKYKHQDKQN